MWSDEHHEWSGKHSVARTFGYVAKTIGQEQLKHNPGPLRFPSQVSHIARHCCRVKWSPVNSRNVWHWGFGPHPQNHVLHLWLIAETPNQDIIPTVGTSRA